MTKTRPREKELYRQVWTHPEYRKYSPGEEGAQAFLGAARPKPGATVIDFGCGTGRGGLMLAVLGQMDVTLVDFADNCLDDDVRQMLTTQSHTLRFIEADITENIPAVAQYGFCADVMEHIPTDLVDQALDRMLMSAQHCWFQISTKPDVMGELVGHPLHLTVKPRSWWLQKFVERECIVHFSAEGEHGCVFYVSAWSPGQTIVEAGVLNVEVDQILQNIRTNIAAGWQQVTPHEANNVEVLILGGGPSLAAHEDEIRRRHAAGAKIWTLNGAFNWCMERGIGPVNQVVVDARDFNARFTHLADGSVDERCMYFIASQCDPSVLEGLPRARTYLWHTSAEQALPVIAECYGEEPWYGIPGGSTVLLRAIPMMRLLGFQKFHLFGCDSCLTDDEHHAFSQHHAYEQPENDGMVCFPVEVGGKVFQCHPWMASQAHEFIALIAAMGDEIEIEVHGGGLLGWILEYAAGQYDEQLLTLQDQALQEQATQEADDAHS